jgi:hypothetical protein
MLFHSVQITPRSSFEVLPPSLISLISSLFSLISYFFSLISYLFYLISYFFSLISYLPLANEIMFANIRKAPLFTSFNSRYQTYDE